LLGATGRALGRWAGSLGWRSCACARWRRLAVGSLGLALRRVGTRCSLSGVWVGCNLTRSLHVGRGRWCRARCWSITVRRRRVRYRRRWLERRCTTLDWRSARRGQAVGGRRRRCVCSSSSRCGPLDGCLDGRRQDSRGLANLGWRRKRRVGLVEMSALRWRRRHHRLSSIGEWRGHRLLCGSATARRRLASFEEVFGHVVPVGHTLSSRGWRPGRRGGASARRWRHGCLLLRSLVSAAVGSCLSIRCRRVRRLVASRCVAVRSWGIWTTGSSSRRRRKRCHSHRRIGRCRAHR
jgi:hypothetical protein